MAKAKPKPVVLSSSNEETMRVLEALCRYQQEVPTASKPVLIGFTGAGKTERLLSLQKTLGLPLLEIPLGCSPPEDMGMPSNPPNKPYYTFKIMEELYKCVEKPHILFFDEADKIQSDTLGVCLKVLHERKVRNYVLHPKTVIVLAMQPVNPSIWLADQTGQAVSARMTFLPVPYDWKYVEQKHNILLPHLHERERTTEITLPVTLASPRTIDNAISFLKSSHGLGLTKPEKAMVLYGSMAPQDAEQVEAQLNQSLAWIDPVAIARINPMEACTLLDVHTLCQQIGPLIEVLTPEAWTFVLKKVWLEGSEEDAATFLKEAYTHLKARCEANPEGYVDIFGQATPEEIVKASNDAATAIFDEWEKINKAAEGKKAKS